MDIHYQSVCPSGLQDFISYYYFRSINYDEHYIAWIMHLREKRYWNVWYRGKITRMTQLKQIKNEPQMYQWLKDFWRRELEINRGNKGDSLDLFSKRQSTS